MGKRGQVLDYAGEAIYPGDLVTYATRCGNRVRCSDAIVIRVFTERVAGRVEPRLLVQPTGIDSGYGLGERKSLRRVPISPEHVRLIRSQYAPVQSRDGTGRS